MGCLVREVAMGQRGSGTEALSGPGGVSMCAQARRWDAEAGVNTETYNGSKVVCALACAPQGGAGAARCLPRPARVPVAGTGARDM